ncbi:hypothetical protein SAMN05421854_114199 [Amycolatopsis rubida]|uniref:Uncharacterized protein n=1 Tax=Amycolatopsis rubida TaxID=112413 RepID=A0A1I5ZCJ9_9PSEU|nr:hypothetical protein SAMN05421854_114199 [Amycolatopsis rubida]
MSRRPRAEPPSSVGRRKSRIVPGPRRFAEHRPAGASPAPARDPGLNRERSPRPTRSPGWQENPAGTPAGPHSPRHEPPEGTTRDIGAPDKPGFDGRRPKRFWEQLYRRHRGNAEIWGTRANPTLVEDTSDSTRAPRSIWPGMAGGSPRAGRLAGEQVRTGPRRLGAEAPNGPGGRSDRDRHRSGPAHPPERTLLRAGGGSDVSCCRPPRPTTRCAGPPPRPGKERSPAVQSLRAKTDAPRFQPTP